MTHRSHRKFPNPFGKTLCIPHLAFYPLRFFVQLMFHVMYAKVLYSYTDQTREGAQKKRKLLEWQNRRRREIRMLMSPNPETDPREKELQKRKAELRFDMCQVLTDYSVLSSDTAFVVTDFLDLDDTCIAQMADECETSAVKHWYNFVTRNAQRFELYRHWLSLAATVLSLAACSAQFHLWRVAPLRRAASNWYLYQGLFMALLQVSGAPLLAIVWPLFAHTTLKRTSRRIAVLRPGTGEQTLAVWRIVFALAPLTPYFCTHVYAGIFVYMPLMAIVAFPLGFVLLSLDEGFTLIFNDEELAESCVAAFFVAICEFSSVWCSVAFVRLSNGHSWANGFLTTFYGNYCEGSSWVVFDTPNFSWREWVVLVCWLL